MVRETIHEKQAVWQCEECGYSYIERGMAYECERWCKIHHSCNTEFSEQAVNR